MNCVPEEKECYSDFECDLYQAPRVEARRYRIVYADRSPAPNPALQAHPAGDKNTAGDCPRCDNLVSNMPSPLNRWIVLTACGLAAVIFAVETTNAQSSGDKWWPGYGNGPENSRYFASKQI